MRGHTRKLITALLAVFVLLPSLSFSNEQEKYIKTFLAYSKSLNPFIQMKDAKRLAYVNWALAGGWEPLAVRLAAEEGVECSLQVLAFLPNGTPRYKKPRMDCLGSHNNLTFQELRRLGTCKDEDDWRHSEEFEQLREKFSADPIFGTWVVGQAFIRKFKVIGSLDMTSHWWQSGKTEMIDFSKDEYLITIYSLTRKFYSLRPGVPRKVATKKIRRK